MVSMAIVCLMIGFAAGFLTGAIVVLMALLKMVSGVY